MPEFEFEVRISVEGGDGAYYVEHRFSARPDIATVRSLKDEAVEQYEALYEHGFTHEVNVSVSYVDPTPDTEYLVLEEDNEPITEPQE